MSQLIVPDSIFTNITPTLITLAAVALIGAVVFLVVPKLSAGLSRGIRDFRQASDQSFESYEETMMITAHMPPDTNPEQDGSKSGFC